MNATDSLPGSTNVHYNTAIALCAISYDSIADIRKKFSKKLSTNLSALELAWGPAELKRFDGESYSLMYIAQNSSTHEYYVVIAGTNAYSITGWLESLEFNPAQPFGSLNGSPNAPSDALISLGTFKGTNDLLTLIDPKTKQTAVAFLKGLDLATSYIYVTGHSLGGTLTPVMFAYLNSVLMDGDAASNMALWSFAGLTPGGSGFNEFFAGLSSNAALFQNILDVAPYLWFDQSTVENIYANHNIQMTKTEQVLIDTLFNLAGDSGIIYAQPLPGTKLTGTFNNSPNYNSWEKQASQQHHHETYETLIAAAYPLSNS